MDSKAERGRPSKLNEFTRNIIIEGVRSGLPYEKCCARARVSYRAYRTWILKGEEELEGEEVTEDEDEVYDRIENRSIYANFVLDHREAEADCIDKWMTQIDTAATGGAWQASAWRLERRYPSDFGRHLLEVTGADGRDLNPPSAITVVEVVRTYQDRASEEE